MDGTIAVLVGMLIVVVAGLIWFVRQKYPVIIEALVAVEKRVEVLEKRKALLTEAAVSADKPAGVGKRTLRTWNENVGQAE